MSSRTWTSPLSRVGIGRLGEIPDKWTIIVPSWEGAPRQVFIALLVAAGYYLGSRIGFLLTPRDAPISMFWPPNAILLAAFVLAPSRKWWIYLLAVLPVHLFIQLSLGVPVATACGWFTSNCSEALIGAACLRHFKQPEEVFDNVSGVLAYLAFGVVVATFASSFVDAAVVTTTGFGHGYWTLWRSRLFSNMLADLTVTPTIIVFASLIDGRRMQPPHRLRIVEATLLTVAILVVSSFAFGVAYPSSPSLMYSPLPLIVWAVVRFGVAGLYPSLLSISTIAIWNATRGRGPFLLAPTAESIHGMQIFLCTFALPMMLLAAVLAERKRVEESLRQSRGQLIDAQEQERRRIARELHDDIGQQLALLEVEFNLLEQQGGSLRPHLEKLHRQTSATSASVRALSHELHSAHLELLGLVPAVRNLCETVARETSIETAFMQENVPSSLDPQISLCLYRVVQESLNNIVRHSEAHKAAVQLRGNGERIFLQIVDDGVGIAPEREHAAGLGLASMRERIKLVGGTLNILSKPMCGTTVDAIVPLRREPLPTA